MKEHIHTSLHRIKGIAANGAREPRERDLLQSIYHEAEKALRRDAEEERAARIVVMPPGKVRFNGGIFDRQIRDWPRPGERIICTSDGKAIDIYELQDGEANYKGTYHASYEEVKRLMEAPVIVRRAGHSDA